MFTFVKSFQHLTGCAPRIRSAAGVEPTAQHTYRGYFAKDSVFRLHVWAMAVAFWVAGTLAMAAPDQESLDSLTPIYEQLDEQLQLGKGRIGARRRPASTPQAVTETSNSHFVPRTREQFRRELDARFERSIEQLRANERSKNEALFSDIKKLCGTKQLEAAKIGMTVRQFEECGTEIRFGGDLTHVISLQISGHAAKLYAFSKGYVHKVYAVDGRITRITPHPQRAVRVTLPTVGAYPPMASNPQVVALSQGNFFAYGSIRGEDWSMPANADLRTWGQKRGRIQTLAPPLPFMWDADRQGWMRQPPPPSCSGLWHQHTLTALGNDRVLVAGGMCDIPRLANDMGAFEPQIRTALWDTRQRAWLNAPNLNQPRIHHTATRVGDQRVMLVGGLDDPLTTSEPDTAAKNASADIRPQAGLSVRVLRSVELFSGDRFETLPPLNTARAKHAATVMPSGAVLVTGGVGENLRAQAQVELWDEALNRWMVRAPMRTARHGHAATLLDDGRVLVTGGINAQEIALNTTELYDPVTDTWSEGPPLPEHLQGHAAIRLQDGGILLAGGQVGTSSLAPWLYSWHPSEKMWRSEGVRDQSTLAQRSHRPTLIEISAGKILAFGSNAVYLYSKEASGQLATDTAGPTHFNFPPAWWTPPAPEPEPLTSPSPETPGQPSRLVRFAQDLWHARGMLALLAAGMATLWILGRAWGRYRSAQQPAAPASRATRWLVRALIYGTVVVVAGPHLIAYWGLQSGEMAELCQSRATACLDSTTHLLARQWGVPGRSKFSKPRIPCPFVGEWVTRRGAREFVIKMHDDGTYRMSSNTRHNQDDTGYWAVQGKYILWRSGITPTAEMDINRIVANDGHHFELVETNGLHSHFDRQADLPQQRCEQ